MTPQSKKITYEEFLQLDSNTEEYLEYVDGQVYNQASPSTIHQRVSVNFTAELRNYFRDKECELFHAPFDIQLKNEDEGLPRSTRIIYKKPKGNNQASLSNRVN
ncbi:Uma2 family endonuclease [Clostridium sp. WILCCON 0269]|uniref:Uma2 family endonuclease n=1 Tax=Candidatus Clostridium eludens TaxID=3381663 RepID=A0ABW8SFH2_9CLOT